MSKYKNVVLVILWFILAIRVGTSLRDASYDTFVLVLLAWLGGLVTGELVRLTIEHFRDRANRF